MAGEMRLSQTGEGRELIREFIVCFKGFLFLAVLGGDLWGASD